MNAPWKPGVAGNRDPFAAFICDETALDVLRPVVIELGWAPEKCAKGGLRNAVQSLSIAASPAILMVDLSESGDPLNDINALAEVCEPGTVVIAIGQVNDVRLYRDLVASVDHRPNDQVPHRVPTGGIAVHRRDQRPLADERRQPRSRAGRRGCETDQ